MTLIGLWIENSGGGGGGYACFSTKPTGKGFVCSQTVYILGSCTALFHSLANTIPDIDLYSMLKFNIKLH